MSSSVDLLSGLMLQVFLSDLGMLHVLVALVSDRFGSLSFQCHPPEKFLEFFMVTIIMSPVGTLGSRCAYQGPPFRVVRPGCPEKCEFL